MTCKGLDTEITAIAGRRAISNIYSGRNAISQVGGINNEKQHIAIAIAIVG